MARRRRVGRSSTIRASRKLAARCDTFCPSASRRTEAEGEAGTGTEKGNGGSEGKSGDDGASSPTANGTPSIVVEDAARNLTITESLELLFDRISADHPRHDSDFRRVTLGGRRLAGGGSGGWIDRILRAVGVGQPSASTGGFIGPLPRPAGPSEKFGDPLTAPLPRAPNLKILLPLRRGQTDRARVPLRAQTGSDRQAVRAGRVRARPRGGARRDVGGRRRVHPAREPRVHVRVGLEGRFEVEPRRRRG